MTDTSSVQVPLLSKAEGTPPQNEKVKHESKALRFQEVGVWTIMREPKISWNVPGFSGWGWGRDKLEMFPLAYRFVHECLSVGTWLVAVYFVTSIWSGTESAVSLYFSSRLLDIIQHSIVDRQVDTHALVTAVASRVGFTLANCVVQRTRQQTKTVISTRIRYLFEARLIQANLRLDIPTFEEPETASKINRLFNAGAWDIFEDLINRFQGVASIISQLGFLFGVLRSQPGGGWFAVICLAKSILDNLTYTGLWSETTYIWDSNPHYRRMASLASMVASSFHRIEIVSDVLVNYIQREWTKARNSLGDLSDEYPESVLHSQRSILFTFFDAIAEDFPLIFYAYRVFRSPSSFSLTSVALMQQTSWSLGYTISTIMSDQNTIQQRFSDIKSLYDTAVIENKVHDGELAYPPDNTEPSSGMDITFQNVSFAYPDAENVVKDVSFNIGRGQTVVIVGVNGSGKSTLLKLFNRLYDPAAGTVLVDGVPMRSFKASDVRKSTAILFQNYSHYPLSIRENISLGLPDMDTTETRADEKGKNAHEELVREAARLGGSIGFVDEQKNGLSTVLKPHINAWSTSSRDPSKTFKDKMKEINKRVDVSLGQWQRLALSRLFFRAAGKGIKLVAVDEPSASLDPKMEYELFERLKELSTAQGKTMVFVTHRFGYLTKRADLILVMQNGRLVEQGKHNELLEMNGEYTKLYNLQAEAFLPSANPK